MPFVLPPTPRSREYFARGLGCGVIVDAENGYILTNYHVVGGADEVEVILYDERKVKAQWIRSDNRTDLAVVKIDADDLIDAPLGDSDEMAVGDWVLAVGSPRGLRWSVTAGIVSAKGRQVVGGNMYENSIQTDAAINQGNSGGPLVNMRGEVVGINNAIASLSGGNEGIGFAIPSNMAEKVMEQLIEKGEVVRGFLGVVMQDVDPLLAESFDLPDTDGALIADVMPDSPADKAGIKEGDFIVSIDGEKITNSDDLRMTIADLAPGQEVEIEFYRDGELMEAEVELIAQPEELAGPAHRILDRELAEDYGLEVETLTEDMAERLGYQSDVEGVVITKISPFSEAAEQGLTAGMVITHVGEEVVVTAEEFADALEDADEQGVRLRVVTPRATKYVFITPSAPADED
jgi:serine protease Do